MRPGSVPDRWRTAMFPRHSSLRRSSDRWETASRWGALVLLIMLIPVVSAVGGARAQAVRDQAGGVRVIAHPVVGSVLAVSAPPRSEDGYARDESTVLVAWTGPGGAVHSASQVIYSAAPRVGDVWSIWVDLTGAPVPPPATGPDASREGAVAALGVLLGRARRSRQPWRSSAGCSTVAACGTGTRTGPRSGVAITAPPTDPHAAVARR